MSPWRATCLASVVLAMTFLAIGCTPDRGPDAGPIAATTRSPTATPPAPETRNDPRCPSVPPTEGADCEPRELACRYPSLPRCPVSRCTTRATTEAELRARGGDAGLAWVVGLDYCPYVCPPSKPVAGGPCSPVSVVGCHYSAGTKCGFDVHCTPQGWAEQEVTLCGGM